MQGRLRSTLRMQVHSRGDSMLCEHDRTGEKTEQEQKRLLALSNFQKTALRHAMHFPRLQRLVYSTCSVSAASNGMPTNSKVFSVKI